VKVWDKGVGSQRGTWGTLLYPPRDIKRVLPLQLMDPKEPGLDGGGGGAYEGGTKGNKKDCIDPIIGVKAIVIIVGSTKRMRRQIAPILLSSKQTLDHFISCVGLPV